MRARQSNESQPAQEAFLGLCKELHVRGEVVELVSFSEKSPKKSWKCFCRANVNNAGLSPWSPPAETQSKSQDRHIGQDSKQAI